MWSVVDKRGLTDAQTVILVTMEELSSLQVPKLVEEGIVLVLLKCLQHDGKVTLAICAIYVLVEVSHFNVYDSSAILDGSRKVRVDTLTDQDHFYDGQVQQVRPAYSLKNVKLLVSEVRHEAKAQHIVVGLGYEILMGGFCNLRVLCRKLCF